MLSCSAPRSVPLLALPFSNEHLANLVISVVKGKAIFSVLVHKQPQQLMEDIFQVALFYSLQMASISSILGIDWSRFLKWNQKFEMLLFLSKFGWTYFNPKKRKQTRMLWKVYNYLRLGTLQWMFTVLKARVQIEHFGAFQPNTGPSFGNPPQKKKKSILISSSHLFMPFMRIEGNFPTLELKYYKRNIRHMTFSP